jgi:hypothetical protein
VLISFRSYTGILKNWELLRQTLPQDKKIDEGGCVELREIHREITAPALACVLLEAQVLVEADRIVPIPTGLDDQSAQTALAGVVEELLAESTRNAQAAIGGVSRDAHDLAPCTGLNQQSASADECVLLFGHEKEMAGRQVAGGDVVEIGGERLVDKAEVFTKPVQDECAGGGLIMDGKRANVEFCVEHRLSFALSTQALYHDDCLVAKNAKHCLCKGHGTQTMFEFAQMYPRKKSEAKRNSLKMANSLVHVFRPYF